MLRGTTEKEENAPEQRKSYAFSFGHAVSVNIGSYYVYNIFKLQLGLITNYYLVGKSFHSTSWSRI
jgi:hypothetical protein